MGRRSACDMSFSRIARSTQAFDRHKYADRPTPFWGAELQPSALRRRRKRLAWGALVRHPKQVLIGGFGGRECTVSLLPAFWLILCRIGFRRLRLTTNIELPLSQSGGEPDILSTLSDCE